jgi:hypothetical protein
MTRGIDPAVSAAYDYEVGEDVLATIENAEIFDLREGGRIPPPPCRRWVIGTVMDRRVCGDGVRYTLRVGRIRGRYMVVVTASAIEGVA